MKTLLKKLLKTCAYFIILVTGFHLIASLEQMLWEESKSYAISTYNDLEREFIAGRGYVPKSEDEGPVTPELALNRAANKAGVSFCLLRAFTKQESTFNPAAISDPKETINNKPAYGLLQIQLDTANRFCGDIKPKAWTMLKCLGDTQCNADCGSTILKSHLKRTRYDIARTAQLYFNGELCTDAKICPKTVVYTREVSEKLATDPSC